MDVDAVKEELPYRARKAARAVYQVKGWVMLAVIGVLGLLYWVLTGRGID